MENFEQLFINSLIRMILDEKLVDQWGNTVQSPMQNAVQKFVTNRHDDIYEAVIKKIDLDDLSNKLAKRVTEIMTVDVHNVWANSSDKEAKKSVQARALEIVAQKLAEKQLEELKLKTVK